jgi:hypothetical protein
MTVCKVDKNAEAKTIVVTAEFKNSIDFRASRPQAGRHDHLLHVGPRRRQCVRWHLERD